jgi:hypothetical protein
VTWPSGNPPERREHVGHRHRLDGARRDELPQGGLRDADVAADTDEPDATFRDEPPGEPLAGGEQLGGLSNGEQSVNGENDGPPSG